ncbi:MAG: membrane protein insertion efficiency factor YidD [Bacteroidia bacterium]
MFTSWQQNIITRVHLAVLALLFCCFSLSSIAQEGKEELKNKLLERSFSIYRYSKAPARRLLSLRNKSLVYRINPVTYISAGALFIYQNVISQQIQASCMYEISCSEFTKRSIEREGFIKGLLSGINQLTNCMPSAIDEHCAYVISKDLKIINSLED